MNLRSTYTLLAVMFWAVPSWAFEARATVDRTRMAAGDSLNLTVTVEGGEADVDVSGMTDFRIVSRGTAFSMRRDNTQVSRETIYTFTLIPLRTGSLQIPALTVRHKKEEQRTAPIAVHVSQGEPVQEEQQDMFARVEVSDPEPYLGQQIRYVYTFYTAVELRSANLTQMPSFNGFASEQIDKERKYRSVMNGREFQAIELDYLLTPLKTGELEIEPAVLECGVIVRDRRRGRFPMDSFFDDPFFGAARVEQRVVKSTPLSVRVRSLPEYQGAAKYTGLVGDFSMEAMLIRPGAGEEKNPGSADQRQAALKEGDSVTLKIVLTGHGNFRDAELPPLSVPDGIKAYQSEPETEITPGETGYTGRKVFSTAFVPVSPGNYELPSVELSFFDPAQGRYRSLSSGPFHLSVQSSGEKKPLEVFGGVDDGEIPKLKRKKVAFTGRDILPPKEDLDALKNSKPFPIWFFGLMILLPAGVCLAAGLFVRFRAREERPSDIMARRSREALKSVASATSDEAFYSSLRRALVSAVFASAGTRGESLTSVEAGDLLAQKGVSAEVAKRVAEVLQLIDSARYGGGGDKPAGKQLLEEVRAIIRSLI